MNTNNNQPIVTNAPIVAPTKVVTLAMLKEVRAHARQSLTLVLGLQAYLDKAEGEKGKERAILASAKLGAQQLRAINALPSDPAKLRQYVEGIKQKTQAIVAQMQPHKSFATFNDANAIKIEANKALNNCEQFIAEYTEGKAILAQAKAA